MRDRALVLMRPIGRLRLFLHVPQRTDRTGLDAAVKCAAHSDVHIGAERRFHRDIEAAAAESQTRLDMLGGGDADTAAAVDTLTRFMHQPSGKMFSRHVFARAGLVLVAVDLVFLRISTQRAIDFLAAVTLHASGRALDDGCREKSRLTG